MGAAVFKSTVVQFFTHSLTQLTRNAISMTEQTLCFLEKRGQPLRGQEPSENWETQRLANIKFGGPRLKCVGAFLFVPGAPAGCLVFSKNTDKILAGGWLDCLGRLPGWYLQRRVIKIIASGWLGRLGRLAVWCPQRIMIKIIDSG